MKRIKFIIAIIISIMITGCGSSTNEISYVDGNIASGKSIEDYYTLSGKTEVLAYTGSKVIAINVCDVSSGGCVAWKDDYYTFSVNGAKQQVAMHLAIKKFNFEPMDL